MVAGASGDTFLKSEHSVCFVPYIGRDKKKPEENRREFLGDLTEMYYIFHRFSRSSTHAYGSSSTHVYRTRFPIYLAGGGGGGSVTLETAQATKEISMKMVFHRDASPEELYS